MWTPRSFTGEKKGPANKLVAVAIDKDKGSQSALKWAIDNLLNRGQNVVLVHVKISDVSDGNGSALGDSDPQTKELFLPFRCFCTRKDIESQDVVLDDTDVVKALIDFVHRSAIEVLVLGAASKSGLLRKFKMTDTPASVLKGVPDFCTVYVISKGKITSTRAATRPPPSISPLRILYPDNSSKPDMPETPLPPTTYPKDFLPVVPRPQSELSPYNMHNDTDTIKSPFTHRKNANGRSYGELSPPDTDISFVSSGRPSIDHMFPSFYDSVEMSRNQRLSSCSETDNHGFDSLHFGRNSLDMIPPSDFSFVSHDSDISSASQALEDVELEMRRLKLELKQTMDMYSTACKEALTAKQKATELQRWKIEEQQRLEEARLAEEAALALAEMEKAKSKACH
ncbi:hypothetical protein F0562_011666 [Nyssa sinensis]|uniref:RING-type E3 ubiquitin transferase n=1 Tax=Nyssa sinensis TaxID=561372 RepID=A0A5J4ZQ31_9ASTE|nr:hypothetical protein F0562_011666 [Nyssa sinensis]